MVEVGACRIVGALVVPGGVTLRGVAGTVVEGPADGTAITLVPAASGAATTVSSLTVESHGTAGVVAHGAGLVALTTVVIEADAGVAVGLESVDASLSDVRIVGPVTRETRDDVRWLRVTSAPASESACPTTTCECEPGARDGDRTCDATGRWATITLTHGLFARGGAVHAVRLSVMGFAAFGIVLEDVAADMSASSVSEGLGVGLEASGGALAIDALDVGSIWTGLRGVPAYGLLAVAGAEVTSVALTVHDSDGYGLVQHEASGVHTGLVVERVGDVGVWAGSSPRLEIVGAGSRIEDASFAGVLAVGSAEVSLDGLAITGTRAVRRAVSVRGAVEVGDGIELVRVPRYALRAVRIVGAERAGLVLDASGGVPAGAFDGVTIDGTALGAVAGSIDEAAETLVGGAPPGWDDGITRLGATVANDAAFVGSLAAVVVTAPPTATDVLGAIAPMY